MRIIAGKYRGRKLLEAKHLKDLRPTTDANRENLFNILSSSKKIKNCLSLLGWNDFKLEDCNFLDVCCGSGAVAFEAISRGAIWATLIDKNHSHLNIAKENAQILKATDLDFFCLNITQKIIKAPRQYNLIFIDPPYQENISQIAFQNLIESGWIAQNALIIIEHHKQKTEQLLTTNSQLKNLDLIEQRQYKETIFSFYALKK